MFFIIGVISNAYRFNNYSFVIFVFVAEKYNTYIIYIYNVPFPRDL